MAALTLQFSLTQAGQQSIFTQNNLGLQLNLTHLQAGSGQYAATGLETKLKTPVQAVTLADGGRSADGLSINMLAVLEGDSNFPIGELGLWAGDPSLASSVLVAVWSETKSQIAAKLGLAAGYDPNTAYIGFKSSGSAWQFAHTLSIADAGAGVINVTVDPSASVAANLLRNHASETNPHPNSRDTLAINNAIALGGAALNTADTTQLARAISVASLNGATFIDAGGSTATVRNLKPLNPNLVLPTNAADWEGVTITTTFIVDTPSTNIAINIYDNSKKLIINKTLSDSSYLRRGQPFDIYIGSSFALIKNLTYMIKSYVGGHLEYDGNRVDGHRWFTFTSAVNVTNASTTNYQPINLPINATYMERPIATSYEAVNAGGFQLDYTVIFSDLQSGSQIAYQSYVNGVRSSRAVFSYQIKGRF